MRTLITYAVCASAYHLQVHTSVLQALIHHLVSSAIAEKSVLVFAYARSGVALAWAYVGCSAALVILHLMAVDGVS